MALASVIFIAAGGVQVYTDMRGSVHDLSLGDEGVCVYCHTPMSASSDSSAPLSNREISNRTFAMYSSPTMDMTVESIPGEVSLVCLSCHDGATAFDALINNPGVSNKGVMTGRAAIGADGLANDHPIAVEYDPSKDPHHAPVTNGKVGELPLFAKSGGASHRTQIECATCHNAHDSSYGNFLRMSNARSRLCLTCHRK